MQITINQRLARKSFSVIETQTSAPYLEYSVDSGDAGWERIEVRSTAIKAWQDQLVACRAQHSRSEGRYWERAAILYQAWAANSDYVNAILPHLLRLVGVFSSRSPNRPNPIAFCVADLICQESKYLVVRGVDALGDSPLLDIKPYAPALDCIPQVVNGHIPDGLDDISKGKKPDA
jgi:hypothetical protein